MKASTGLVLNRVRHKDWRARPSALQAAEATKQQTITPSSTAAQIKTAEATYYRACIASCRTNNSSAGIEQFTTVLRELTGSAT